MTQRIYVLNGPNLNRLGKRGGAVDLRLALADIEAACRDAASGYEVVFRQSNAESQIVDWVHEAIDEDGAGIIINPAGLSFTSVPIMDALKMFPGPIFELHISNIHRREAVYHDSLISKVATAVLVGLGSDGYRVALEALVRRLATA
jgi:3-dehydroquinate dehydratase II